MIVILLVCSEGPSLVFTITANTFTQNQQYALSTHRYNIRSQHTIQQVIHLSYKK